MTIQPTKFAEKPSRSKKRFPIVSLRYEEWERIVALAERTLSAAFQDETIADNVYTADCYALQKLKEEMEVGK